MANTINFNPPAIKAARITGKGGSSGGGGGTANWSNIGRDIASVGTSITAGLQARQASIKFEKDQQLELLKNRENLRTLQYDKVAMIDTLPNSTFEKSKNGMLYGLMDKFVNIKTALDDPSSGLDPATGQKALAEIMQTITKYKQQAPAILAAASSLQAALKKPFGTAGAIAGGVPTAQQQILLSLIEGGNVEIAAKDGEMYLYKLDDNSNVTSVFNIDEYMSTTKNGTDPEAYFRTIIDTSKESEKGVGAILGSSTDPMASYYDVKRETNAAGDSIITSTVWRTPPGGGDPLLTKEAAIQNVGQTSFGHLIDDPNFSAEMEDYWNDVIGADASGISGQDAPWNPTDETKRTYQVKGYIDKATGEFIFSPTGNKTRTYTDALGKELELTQKEFAQRWMAEQAIQQYGPTIDRTIGITKADEKDGKGSKGFFYDVDEKILANSPFINRTKGGMKTRWVLEDDNYVLNEYDTTTSSYLPTGTKISAYKMKDGKIVKDKNGNPVYNLAQLRSAMDSDRKTKQ